MDKRNLPDSRSFYPIVDVLRALSVLAVVAYHAGVPWVPGGYVGVDVFFVISGFLIIGHIVGEHMQGSFSYAGFWARRALRILPSYLLVIVVAAMLAKLVLVMPAEFDDFGRQVVWSAGMVVNHLFLSEQGYFDTAAEAKPLLHLWSLAVEEQFYLLAPVTLAFLCWLARPKFGAVGRRLVVLLVVSLFLASLLLCIKYTATSDDDKNYSFYLMPLRAWEFILGGGIPFCLPLLNRLPPWLRSMLMVAGFVMIAFAILGFSHHTPFPSWRALVPAAGAAIVIAAGLSDPKGRLVRALATRPVLWVGLVSYAWYLWHWPLMTFSRIYNFGELSLAWGISMGLLSFLLACLTYLLVENPIKRWRIRTKTRMGARPIIAGLTACALVAAAGGVLAGQEAARAKEGISNGLLPGSDRNAGACTLNKVKSIEACQRKLKEEGRRRVGIVIGDSHAIASYSALRSMAEKRDSSLVSMTRVGCVPMIGVRLHFTEGGALYNCHQAKERGLRYVFRGDVKPEYAIIYAHWNNAAPWIRADGSLGRPYRYLVDAKTKASKPEREVFVRSLKATIRKLQKAGVQRILIMAATPEFLHAPSSCVIRSDKYGVDRDKHCAVSSELVTRRRYFSTAWLSDAVLGMKDVRMIDPMPVFCDEDLCRGYDRSSVFYRDDDHINRKGMNRIIERYKPDFDWVFGR